MATAAPSDKTHTHQWLVKFHALSDALSARPWITTFFRPDAVVNYANNPTLTGHEAIIASMDATFAGLESMEHGIGDIDITPDRIYQEATIRYVVKGDPRKEEFVVKGFAVFHKRVDEDVVRRFDVYGDFSAVYARMAEVGGGSGGEGEGG